MHCIVLLCKCRKVQYLECSGMHWSYWCNVWLQCIIIDGSFDDTQIGSFDTQMERGDLPSFSPPNYYNVLYLHWGRVGAKHTSPNHLSYEAFVLLTSEHEEGVSQRGNRIPTKKSDNPQLTQLSVDICVCVSWVYDVIFRILEI